jgi:hypothetical protein
VCGGLQNGMDFVCIGSGLTVTVDESEGRYIEVEEALHILQEDDHLAVALPAVKCADEVCYVCNFMVLTVVQVCTVACAWWQCVVWV